MASKGNLQFNIDANADQALKAVQSLFGQVEGGAKASKAVIDQYLGAPIRQVIEVRQEVDTNGTRVWKADLKEVGSYYDQIKNKIDAANKIQDGSVTRLRQQVNEAKQVRDSISQFAVELKKGEDGTFRILQKTKEIDPAWTKANEKVKYLTRELQVAGASNFWDRVKGDLGFTGLEKAGRFVNDLVNTFQSVSIVVGQITAVVNQFVTTLGKLQQYEKTFQAIGLGAAATGEAFSEANRIALSYGVGIDTVREGFVKLAPTVLQTGGTLGDVGGIMEALSSRFVAFGLGADQSNRVMNAVIQAFGKGKLMAEELTQQISEADPAFRVDFANALGVSVTKLNDMVKAGEITNEVMREVIPNMREGSVSIEQFGGNASLAVDDLQRFGEGANVTTRQVVSLIDSTNQLSFERIVRSADELIAGVLDIGASFSVLFKTLSESQAVELLSSVFGRLLNIIADVIGVINFLATVVITITDGVLGFINVIDEFVKGLIGIEPIATLLATVLGVGLLGAVTNLIGVFDNTSKLRVFTAALSDMANVAKTGVVNSFTSLTKITSAVSESIGGTLSKSIDKSIASLTGISDRTKTTVGSLDNLSGYFTKVGASSEIAYNSFNKVYGSVEELKQPLGSTSVSLDAVGKSGADAASKLEPVDTSLRGINSASITTSDNVYKLGGDFTALETSTLGVGDSFSNATKEIDYTNTNLGYTGTVASSGGSALKVLNSELNVTSTGFRDLGDDAGYYAGAATNTTDISGDLGGVLRTTSDEADGTASSFSKARVGADGFDVSLGQISEKADDSGKKMKALGSILVDFAANAALMAAVTLAFGVYNEATKYSNDINRTLKGSLEATSKALKEQGLAASDAEAGQLAFESKLKQVQTEMRNQGKEAEGLGGFFKGLGSNILDAVNVGKIWNDTLDLGRIAGARGAVQALGQNFAAIEETGKQAKTAVLEFAAAGQTASDVLENSTTQAVVQQIVSYGEFIKKATETRDKLLADAAASTNVATQVALTDAAAKIDKQIQEAQDKLAAFKIFAQNNGIEVAIGIDGKALANTTGGFKEWIKELEAQEAVIKIGTSGFEEAQAKTNAVKALIDELVKTPFEVKLAFAEVDLSVLKEVSDLYVALTNEVKARGEAEIAVGNIIKASAEYQLEKIQERAEAERTAADERITKAEEILDKTNEINNAEIEKIGLRKTLNKEASDARLTQMQEELERMKEQNASQGTIKAKEEEIANYKKQAKTEEGALDKQISDAKLAAKEQEKLAEQKISEMKASEAAAEKQRQADEKAYAEYLKGLEAEMAVNKLVALGEQQAAEKISFAIKQQQEAAERQIVKMKNEQKLAELEIGKITAINTANELEGKARVLASTKGVQDSAVLGLQQQAQGFRDIAGATDGVIARQQQINAKYAEGDAAFKLRQQSEAAAFDANQKAQLANAMAAIAQYGLIGNAVGQVTVKNGEWYRQVGSTIGEAGKIIPIYERMNNFDPSAPWDRARQKLGEFTGQAQSTGNVIEKQIAGFVTVGDKTVTIYKEVGTTLGAAGTKAETAASGAGAGFIQVGDKVKAVGGEIDAVTAKTNQVSSATNAAAGGFTAVGTSAQTAGISAADLSNRVGSVKTSIDEAATGMGNFARKAGEAANGMAPLIGKTSELATSLGTVNTKVGEVGTAIITATGKIQTASVEAGTFAGKFNTASTNVSELGKTIGGLKINERLTEPLQNAKDAIDQISNSNFEVDFKDSATYAKGIARDASAASGSIGSIVGSDIVKTTSNFAAYAGNASTAFTSARKEVDNIVSAFKKLNGSTSTVTIAVKKVDAKFAGGPVQAGQLTTINELGKEAFLTRGGHLSMINKPRNAMWRPPTSGTVIPAHIAKNLNLPNAGVRINSSAASVVQGMARKDAGSTDIARALYAALESSGVISNSRYSATSQATHATQIGKLTHAINKLVDKDWDVNVNIKERNTGLGSHRTINRIL